MPVKNVKDISKQRLSAAATPTPELTTIPLRLDLGCGGNKRAGFHGVDSIAFAGVDTVLNLTQRAMFQPGMIQGELGGGKLLNQDDAVFEPWPWPDGSVTEAHSSHFVEHLTPVERVHFVNELYRVLKPCRKENGTNVEGFCTIIVPHWCNMRAYGDPTHQWPPVSEFWSLYLNREWRMGHPGRPCGACGTSGRGQDGMPCRGCGGNGKVVVPANAPHTDASHWPPGFKCNFNAGYNYNVDPNLGQRHPQVQAESARDHKDAIMDILFILEKLE